MERLALDTRKWSPKEGETLEAARKRAAHDFAAASIEQRQANPEERINPCILTLGEDGRLHDVLGERPRLRWETKSDFLENHAYMVIERWTREKPSQNLIWFSPPDDELGYSEARLIVYTLKEEEEKTQVVMRPLCLPYSEEECLELARELAKPPNQNVAKIDSTDSLRAFPIFFNPRGSTWFNDLEDLIVEAKIWERIRNGYDFKAKEEALRLAEPIVEKYYPRIIAAQNEYEFLLVGARMEIEMAKSGVIFQARGSCGISNQEALNRLQSTNVGIFDSMFLGSISETETVNWEPGVCKKCHQHKLVGGCGFCKDCE